MQNRLYNADARPSHKSGKTVIRALTVACALLSTVPFMTSTAAAKETLKFAFLADPSREAILWAFKNGKVTSDRIAIEGSAMSVPALTQAMPTRQFDVVEVSAFAIPAGAQRGLNLTIIGSGLRPHETGVGFDLWVKSDGPIKKPEDLLGKQVALYSLRSVLAAVIYTALGDVMKLDLKKIEFVETPPPAMPAALSTGRVAAASLIQAQAYQATKSGEYQMLINAGDVFKKAKGMHLPISVLAGYPEKLKQNPELYREFLRVLKESRDYAMAHPNEVFPAVAKETKMDPEFFATWFREYAEFGVDMAPTDLQALDLFWEIAKDQKWIDRYPTAKEVVWDAVLPKK
jgi:NitT/TauT family transport system substrate-binding protein